MEDSGIVRIVDVYDNTPASEAGLAAGDQMLEINGVSYSYKAIETVTMTQPYLMGFSAYHRELTIKLFDSKKPLRFSLGNRIEKDETEEEIGKGNTCIYPALYERIKTDKALNRKFKI